MVIHQTKRIVFFIVWKGWYDLCGKANFIKKLKLYYQQHGKVLTTKDLRKDKNIASPQTYAITIKPAST